MAKEVEITGKRATLNPRRAKAGFWLTVGRGAVHIKDRDEGISITVYSLDRKDDTDGIADLWVLHSELEPEEDEG